MVEWVFAARMCRAINNANVLCLGSMLWGDWMAKEAVEAFLTTNLTNGSRNSRISSGRPAKLGAIAPKVNENV